MGTALALRDAIHLLNASLRGTMSVMRQCRRMRRTSIVVAVSRGCVDAVAVAPSVPNRQRSTAARKAVAAVMLQVELNHTC
jgi:hypothetical protein